MEINRFGYYWLDTWVLANVIQLATQDFCSRFLNHTNDPGGRQYDQMTQAARSAPANIAEGNSRHSTSRETEMKLTDVARATLSELANDYLNWLLRQEGKPMIKRVAKKGINSGKEFWSCSDYPQCNGTRKINDVTT